MHRDSAHDNSEDAACSAAGWFFQALTRVSKTMRCISQAPTGCCQEDSVEESDAENIEGGGVPVAAWRNQGDGGEGITNHGWMSMWASGVVQYMHPWSS